MSQGSAQSEKSADNSNNSILKTPIIAAKATTAAPVWTDGHQVPLSADLSGNLRTTKVRDSGRVLFTARATGSASATADALFNFTPYRDLVAGGASTSLAVTAGKILVLQSMPLVAHGTAIATGEVRSLAQLRLLAGTVLIGSPSHAAVSVGSPTVSVASQYLAASVSWPEGLQLTGTMQVGVSHVESMANANLTMDCFLVGYEY